MDQIDLMNKQLALELFASNKIKLAFNFLGPLVPNDPAAKYAICCYVHTWDKDCTGSTIKLFLGSFVACAKVYSSLYILSAILRGRPIKYWLTKLPNEIFRSTLFLSTNCGLYVAFFCLARKALGGVSYFGSLISSVLASFCAILIERKQRRGVLALYLTNLASETAFNMMVSRKLFGTLPNGEVALFAFGSAVYAYLFKTKSLDGSIQSLVKMLVGSSECLHTDHSVHKSRRSRVVKYYGVVTASLSNFLHLVYNLTRSSRHHRSHNVFSVFFRSLERHLDAALNALSRSTRCKHHLCNHRYNCIVYCLMGFAQRFAAGFALQALIKCIGSIGVLIKNPKFIVKLLKSPVNRELGLFLGTFVLIFRMISCLLRWITNRNEANHGLISGFFAGWSMMFYKSSSIALYINFKLLEILWMLGVENKKLPLFKSFDIVLYVLSTGFVLWMALYEPHNIRPAYQRFINKISDQRFSQINRYFLDIFGLQSSTIDRR